MSDGPKVVQFPNKPNDTEEFAVEVSFVNGDKEEFDADVFGFVEELPGFIHLWKETPYTPLCFINERSIQRIQVIKKSNEINS